MDLVVTGGTVVRSDGELRADVSIRGGSVVALTPPGEAPPSDRRIDADGLLVLPGFVDTHVHLMDPGSTEREDIPTGTAAAAARGVTTIVEHTHSAPVRTADDLARKLEIVRDRSNVDIGLAAHVWPDMTHELEPMWRAGVTFFKIFTCATHGVPAVEGSALRDAFERIAGFDGRCLVHCEDDAVTATNERTLRATGRTDGGVIPEWRSSDAEIRAVRTVGSLAAATGVRATIAHVSSPAAAEAIEEARRDGAHLAAEACPQYLLLTEDEVLRHGAFRKFTPPARAREPAELDAMWDLLATGVLTHVATDHAPSTRRQKLAGDIWDAPFGLPGLDTTSRLLFDAVHRGVLTWPDVALRYAAVPAHRYGLPMKGRIDIGADADLALVDPGATTTIRDEDVISKAGWSPFAGRVVRGDVVTTILRGRVIARHGASLDDRWGRFLPGPGAVASA
jgi:dihydroorotase (multifunctional complex type)